MGGGGGGGPSFEDVGVDYTKVKKFDGMFQVSRIFDIDVVRKYYIAKSIQQSLTSTPVSHEVHEMNDELTNDRSVSQSELLNEGKSPRVGGTLPDRKLFLKLFGTKTFRKTRSSVKENGANRYEMPEDLSSWISSNLNWIQGDDHGRIHNDPYSTKIVELNGDLQLHQIEDRIRDTSSSTNHHFDQLPEVKAIRNGLGLLSMYLANKRYGFVKDWDDFKSIDYPIGYTTKSGREELYQTNPTQYIYHKPRRRNFLERRPRIDDFTGPYSWPENAYTEDGVYQNIATIVPGDLRLEEHLPYENSNHFVAGSHFHFYRDVLQEINDTHANLKQNNSSLEDLLGSISSNFSSLWDKLESGTYVRHPNFWSKHSFSSSETRGSSWQKISNMFDKE